MDWSNPLRRESSGPNRASVERTPAKVRIPFAPPTYCFSAFAEAHLGRSRTAELRNREQRGPQQLLCPEPAVSGPEGEGGPRQNPAKRREFPCGLAPWVNEPRRRGLDGGAGSLVRTRLWANPRSPGKIQGNRPNTGSRGSQIVDSRLHPGPSAGISLRLITGNRRATSWDLLARQKFAPGTPSRFLKPCGNHTVVVTKT
jgi:hypothetical protein